MQWAFPLYAPMARKGQIMKPIKITQDNELLIVAELLKCNSKSVSHTYTDYLQIKEVAINAEKKLLELITKKLAPGAKFVSRSGAALPNSYKYSRQVTTIQLVRRSSDWYLIEANCHGAYKEAGAEKLIITKTQRDFAINKFSNQFLVGE